MSRIKNFEEYIRLGIVKKQIQNKSRVEFLIKESERSYNFLLNLINKIGVDNETANDFVKICYDSLMGLIRAKMLINGYNSSGTGAHEAEVSYMRLLGFSENEVQFADQVRFFRNGIMYYGTLLDEDYAKKVIEFTKKNYLKLKKILNLD